MNQTKLNPLIALMHLIDPIERGHLKFGTKNLFKSFKKSKFKNYI